MRTRCPRILWAALLVAFALAGCQPPGPGASTFEVAASEFKFEPRDITARAGEITFVVRNVGMIEHNFVIEDRTGQRLAGIPTIEVGKTERLTVSLTPGSYTIVCTYPGHREAGMVGTLTVTS